MKKHLVLLIGLLTVLSLLSACNFTSEKEIPELPIGENPVAEPADTVVDTPTTEISADAPTDTPTDPSASEYTGLTVEDAMKLAEKNGVPFRVVEQDGELFAVTLDFRPGRINAVVNSGKVTSYTVEGNEG